MRTTWFASMKIYDTVPSESLCLSLDFDHNLEGIANMDKDAAEICREFHTRLSRIARELPGTSKPMAGATAAL